MMTDCSTWFKKGMRDGVPISLGYFAVSFTLGIAAKKSGLTAIQAMLASLLNNASAGEFAGFTLIAAGSGLAEIALMELVVNARYLLMSCALSQKLDPAATLPQRLLTGFYITDEIFGISISVPGKLNPYYNFGAAFIAAPGWALGTFLGVVLGNILPPDLVSALGVGLYGMFLAVIIPPARKNRVIAGLIAVSMAASFAVSRLSFFSNLSSGTKIILLTVFFSGAAAFFFPVREESESQGKKVEDGSGEPQEEQQDGT